VNVGVGADWSIRQLAEMIAEVVGFTGNLVFDPSKPDGMPAKLLDSSVLQKMGWRAKNSLRDGLLKTYQWFANEGMNRDRDASAIL
jgi:GDP-L-fucose synthase